MCEYTKHQQFSSLAATLVVDHPTSPTCSILVYLMTTIYMENIVYVLYISKNVREIKQKCDYCNRHIPIMVWLCNYQHRIFLLSIESKHLK